MKTIRNTLYSISRHKWLSVATVIVLSLLVVIFDLALTVDSFTDRTFSEISKKVDTSFDLRTNLDTTSINSFLSELRKRPEVQAIKFVSSEDALQKYTQLHPDFISTMQRFEIDNPFASSVEIQLYSPSDHTSLNTYLIEQKDIIETSSLPSENNSQDTATQLSASAATELQRLTDFTNQLFVWMSGVFFVSMLAIVINAIYLSLFVRQEEIAIMRLVGAPHRSISRPYLLEGLILTISSVLIGNLIFTTVALIAGWQSILIETFLSPLPFIQIIIAGLTGIFASHIAVQHYLKRQIIRL